MIYGAASPIPGISGGTLFIFFNIYEDFFYSASLSNVKKNLPVLVSFFLGCAGGLFGISHVIMFLLENHGQVMYFCFIGLILGCVPVIFVKAKADKFRLINAAVFIPALAFMLLLAFSGGELHTNSSLEQLGGITPAVLAWVFFASFMSSMAILIPGVGGSVMMLAFGIYTIYIEAMSTLDPVILPILVISMIFGIWAGIKIIKKMLVSCPQTLYCAILGFIIGSVFIIYPGFSADLTGVMSIILAFLFAVFAYRLSKRG